MLTEEFDPLEGKQLRILDERGEVIAPELEPALGPEVLTNAYRTMVLARVADEKAVVLQRQGRLGAYPPNRGQEAASLGPAMAMGPDDWLVWSFRELSALLWRGLPLEKYLLAWMGHEEGNRYEGGLRITPPAIPVGSQYAYAAGLAYASRYRHEQAVTFAYTGDGGTSEGDFHESVNAAGVFRLPMVMVIQNNQWAISVPRSRQTASPTLAQKACAYGIPGIQVDGNDLLAMYAAAAEARERAMRGDGPTLIEAYTYRLGDHTTSDDARKYRLEAELKEWEPRDPLIRLRAYLISKGFLDEPRDLKVWEEARRLTEEAVTAAEAVPAPTLEEVFAYTYADMPPSLAEQLDRLRRELGGQR